MVFGTVGGPGGCFLVVACPGLSWFATEGLLSSGTCSGPGRPGLRVSLWAQVAVSAGLAVNSGFSEPSFWNSVALVEVSVVFRSWILKFSLEAKPGVLPHNPSSGFLSC